MQMEIVSNGIIATVVAVVIIAVVFALFSCDLAVSVYGRCSQLCKSCKKVIPRN